MAHTDREPSNIMLGIKEEDEKKPKLEKAEPAEDTPIVKNREPRRQEFIGVVIETDKKIAALKRAFSKKVESEAAQKSGGKTQRPHKDPASLRQVNGKCDNCKNGLHCHIEADMVACRRCFARRKGCYWNGINRLGATRQVRMKENQVAATTQASSNLKRATRGECADQVQSRSATSKPTPPGGETSIVEERVRKQFIEGELSRLRVRRSMIEKEIERWKEELEK